MSAEAMDHAGWVQINITAHRKAKRHIQKPSTKGWMAAPAQLTTFQCLVFDILGTVYGGIYNAPISWRTLDWGTQHDRVIAIPLDPQTSLSSDEPDTLSRLVALCQDYQLRLTISSHARHCLTLRFFMPRPERFRSGREGAMAGRPAEPVPFRMSDTTERRRVRPGDPKDRVVHALDPSATRSPDQDSWS